MGFFGGLWDAVSKPVRGIGRIARGKFREGLGDIGSGAKALAPALALTGVGAPLALGIGAAGGALEGGTTGGGGVGNILKGGAGGAARTGAAVGLRGIGSKLLGGGGAAPGVASGVANPAGPVMSAAAPAASAAGPAGIGSRLLGAGKDVAGWVGKNPEVAGMVGGAAANVYGAHQEGAAYDRAASLREEEMRRTWDRQDNADPVLQEIISRLLREQSVN